MSHSGISDQETDRKASGIYKIICTLRKNTGCHIKITHLSIPPSIFYYDKRKQAFSRHPVDSTVISPVSYTLYCEPLIIYILRSKVDREGGPGPSDWPQSLSPALLLADASPATVARLWWNVFSCII